MSLARPIGSLRPDPSITQQKPNRDNSGPRGTDGPQCVTALAQFRHSDACSVTSLPPLMAEQQSSRGQPLLVGRLGVWLTSRDAGARGLNIPPSPSPSLQPLRRRALCSSSAPARLPCPACLPRPTSPSSPASARPIYISARLSPHLKQAPSVSSAPRAGREGERS